MNTQLVNLSCEIELKTGEKLYLPDEIVNGVGAGRWMISIVPIPNPDQAIRQHDAFLNGYAPEDEGLYVIKDELNADYKLMAEDVERETEAFEWAESLIGDVDQ